MAVKIVITAPPAATKASLRASRRIIAATLADQNQSNCQIAVAYVDRQTIRQLNQHYRGKNRATNVLSFAGSPLPLGPQNKHRDLGEIIICPAYALQEAKAADMAAEVRLAHLLIHGTLHLLGYDHETSSAAQRKMEALETKLLNRIPSQILMALRPLLAAKPRQFPQKKKAQPLHDHQPKA